MPKFSRWLLVIHARERQLERGVSDEQIKATVTAPDRSWIQGKGTQGGVKWAFEKNFSGDTLRVVGEVDDDTLLIVTVIWGA
jgi:hypothetical protein